MSTNILKKRERLGLKIKVKLKENRTNQRIGHFYSARKYEDYVFRVVGAALALAYFGEASMPKFFVLISGEVVKNMASVFTFPFKTCTTSYKNLVNSYTLTTCYHHKQM